MVSTIPATTSPSSSGSGFSASRPVAIRETSSSASTSALSRSTFRDRRSNFRSARSSSACSRSLSANISIWTEVSGVLSSWEAMERNSSRTRSASSARARCSRSCSRLRRAVRSRVTFANPTSWPQASRTALMTTLAQNREPFLRSRHPSCSTLPVELGALQLLLAAAGRHVLGGPKAREVLAQDLLGFEAFDPFGAAVPGGHVPLRIQHEDGVVLDGVDQQAKAFFAAPKLLVRLPPRRRVARDLREPDVLTVRAVERGDDDVGPEARAVFANAPTLVLHSPVPQGLGQQASRFPLQAIFGRIKCFDAPPDDLVGQVAFDELGSDVPGPHPPLGDRA